MPIEIMQKCMHMLAASVLPAWIASVATWHFTCMMRRELQTRTLHAQL